jgi:hypothetical protein
VVRRSVHSGGLLQPSFLHQGSGTAPPSRCPRSALRCASVRGARTRGVRRLPACRVRVGEKCRSAPPSRAQSARALGRPYRSVPIGALHFPVSSPLSLPSACGGRRGIEGCEFRFEIPVKISRVSPIVSHCPENPQASPPGSTSRCSLDDAARRRVKLAAVEARPKPSIGPLHLRAAGSSPRKSRRDVSGSRCSPDEREGAARGHGGRHLFTRCAKRRPRAARCRRSSASLA